MPKATKALRALANKYGRSIKADILMYNGSIDRGIAYHVISLCRKRNRRENLFFILVTPGGDANAAYRIGRCLQDKYNKLTIFVPGWCKSAGTLLAVAANELVIGDFGELGPIDVQRIKSDEVWQRSSGLTEESAISTLETALAKSFQDFVSKIRDMSQAQIGFRAAAEVVSPMIVGAFAPIFGQIDPLMIGESARAMRVASDYGHRLDIKGRNLQSRESMENLVSGYADHGFSIDRQEAEQLFNNVSVPNTELEAIFSAIGKAAVIPIDDEEQNWIEYLNDAPRKQARRKRRKRETGNAARAARRPPEAVATTDDGGDSGRPAEAETAGARPNVSPIRRRR